MQKAILLMLGLFIVTNSLLAQTKAGKTDTTKHITYYTCSHHPDIVSEKPGKCPKCGMRLNATAKEQMKTTVTKSYTCPVHVNISRHNPGKCPQCGKKLQLSAKEQMKAAVTKVYTCPMHPEVALDKDGVCPKCGKELTEKKNQ